MTYLVFSQSGAAEFPVEQLSAAAARFFGASLEQVARGAPHLVLRLKCARPALDAELVLRARDVTRGDLEEAHRAEARGRAAGMGALAERCRTVWELSPASGAEPNEAACLTLAAVCASVALGPILPPDRGTLFGVRGALARRDAATS